jgi:hypothetical protein
MTMIIGKFIPYDIGFPNYAAFTKTPLGGSTFNTYGFDAGGNQTYIYIFNAVMQGYTGQNNTILYARIKDGVGQLNLENHTLEEQLIISPTSLPIASSVYDSANSHFSIPTTDYSSTGPGEVCNISGESIGNFYAGISPDAIAIDYRENTGITNLPGQSKIKVSPNPSSNVVIVEVCNGKYFYHVKVIDIAGRNIIAGKPWFKESVANINVSF